MTASELQAKIENLKRLRALMTIEAWRIEAAKAEFEAALANDALPIIEALREYQLKIAGCTRKADDIELAKAVIAEVEKPANGGER